jgi:superfamily II DNA/RNA helicase
MPVKPTKIDRAPKNRWSAAECDTRGHAPHRRGDPPSGFGDLGVPANLVVALSADGIGEPFPIQAATIPDALAGRDVLGRGRTGSGKTLAFGLPMISRLAGSSRRERAQPRGLVLVPTRELAMQVADVVAPLARIAGLSLVLVAGGMPYAPQILAFSRGVDLVVATPGRLIDLMDQGVADLSRIEITVLDEADHMADLGFLPAVSRILDTVPDRGQRLLFSATLDKAVDRLVRNYLYQPVVHQVDTGQASVPLMSHHLVNIAPQHKAELTAELASRPGRTLIFVSTQRGADRVAKQLRRSGILAGALHGGLAQGARTRIMSAFKHGSLPVLVATDVAARGIHVDEVGLVLHADPPNGPKEYLHRAGRTARAGGTGTVVAFALPHQRRELARLTTQAGVRPVMLAASPGDSALAAATGARRASGDAISDADYQRVIAPPPVLRSRSARVRPGDSGVRRPGRRGRRSPTSTAAGGSRSRRAF